MIMWMAYAAVIGVLLAAGAWAGERVCETMGWPRRLPWLVALALVVVIPLSARPPAPMLQVPANASPAVEQVVVAVQDPAASMPGPMLDRVAAIAWGAGSLATLVVFGAILGLVTRARRRWPRRSVDGEDVYVSEDFGPALIGVARPSVVVPEWLFGASERAGRVAIQHEREHARARDHLTLLYGAIIAGLFPWSPAVWWMVRNLRGAVEIDCDRRVIASGIPADDYGELLLAIGVGQHRRWVLTPALVESRHSLERRLKIMAAKKMKWSSLKATALAVLSLAALSIACDANAPTALDDALVEVLGGPEATDGEATDGETAGEALSRTARITADTWDGRRPLIFIDGVEVESASVLSSVNPDNIERIEVIKGTAAADRFGDQGEAGVIQIFTKEPSENDTPSPSGGDGDEGAPLQMSRSSTTPQAGESLPVTLHRTAATLTSITEGSFTMLLTPTEPTTVRFYDIHAPPRDWVNAMELGKDLMLTIRRLGSQ